MINLPYETYITIDKQSNKFCFEISYDMLTEDYKEFMAYTGYTNEKEFLLALVNEETEMYEEYLEVIEEHSKKFNDGTIPTPLQTEIEAEFKDVLYEFLKNKYSKVIDSYLIFNLQDAFNYGLSLNDMIKE